MFCVVCVFSHLILMRSGGLQMLNCMFFRKVSHHIQNLSNIFSSSGCEMAILKILSLLPSIIWWCVPIWKHFFLSSISFSLFGWFSHEIDKHTHTYTILNLLYIHILFLVLLYYIIRPPIESLSSSFFNSNFRIGFLLIFQWNFRFASVIHFRLFGNVFYIWALITSSASSIPAC